MRMFYYLIGTGLVPLIHVTQCNHHGLAFSSYADQGAALGLTFWHLLISPRQSYWLYQLHV